ncbi:ankyrin repeat domain-containing protein [bacterium]|nr:MAG: ankyrin repeat domain-containing protein [bacterium]
MNTKFISLFLFTLACATTAVSAEWSAVWTALHQAAKLGNTDTVQELLENKIFSVNARGWNDWTPLHAAAYAGHLDCVEILVNHGANIHAQAKGGATPALFAQTHGHLDIVNYLHSKAKEHFNAAPAA